MTGTAKTEEEEFVKIYGLDVAVIPTNKPILRDDTADVIYKTKDEKYKAIVKDIKTHHETKQPVLVGTIAIETSELISKLLTQEKIPHQVLNAKFHEKEADIVKGCWATGCHHHCHQHGWSRHGHCAWNWGNRQWWFICDRIRAT